MTAPTVPATGSNTWSVVTGTSRATGSVSWQTGDIVVVVGGTESNSLTLGVPTATGLTFTQLLATNTASTCKGYVWTATAASNGSGAITSVLSTGGNMGNIQAWVIRGSSGVGASTSIASGSADTLSLTRTGTDSLVLMGLFDFGATNDVAVTGVPSTGFHQEQATIVAGRATMFAADWDGQGASGTTSYGIAAFTTIDVFTKVLVELKGTTGGSTLNANGDVAVTATATGTGQVIAQAAGDRATTATLTGTGQVVAQAAGDRTATASLTGTAAVARPAAGDLAATATITGTALRVAGATGDLNAAAGITGTGQVIAQAAGDRTATAGITGTGQTLAQASGSLAATAAATGTAAVVRPASGDVAAVASITGTAVVIAMAHGDLNAVATITGSTGGLTASGDLAAVATISGTAAVARMASGDENAVATITGAAVVARAATGNLAATAGITGTGQLLAMAAGNRTAVATITGTAVVVSPSSGLIGAAHGPLPAMAGTAAPAPTRSLIGGIT